MTRLRRSSCRSQSCRRRTALFRRFKSAWVPPKSSTPPETAVDPNPPRQSACARKFKRASRHLRATSVHVGPSPDGRAGPNLRQPAGAETGFAKVNVSVRLNANVPLSVMSPGAIIVPFSICRMPPAIVVGPV